MSDVQTKPRVSAVIINYNGLAFLDELLHSLRAQSYPSFDTLFLDNASEDGSAAYVRNNYTQVRVLAQSTNLGFSRAGNLAAEVSDGDFLAFLNADVKLDRHWLEALVETALEDSSIAAVASKLRLYSRPDCLNGVGGAMNYLGYTWDRGMFEEDRGQYDASEEVLFASAGAALFRRSAFLAAGGFDPRFFMYHEDVDLCWRLWLLGFRVVTAPWAVAYHHFGAATREARGNLWRELMGERNNMRSLLKNYQWKNTVRACWGLLTLRQSRRRKLGQLRNLVWNLSVFADTLRCRHWIQKRRRRSDEDLKHLIVQSKHVPIRL